MLHTIFAGLKGSFNFEQSLIERVACSDEVDLEESLQTLFEDSSLGLLPKDLDVKLDRFEVNRHHVSRRSQRMNSIWRKNLVKM
jgi:hypothetical protein